MSFTIILMLILAVLLVIFTLQNSFPVTIQAFFWEIPHIPIVIVLLACTLLGYLLAVIYFYPRVWKLERRLSRTAKLEKKLESELDEMKKNHPAGPEGIELDIDDPEQEKKGFFI